MEVCIHNVACNYFFSDEDSADGNPLIAGDEDLSSPEEEVLPQSSRQGTQSIMKDDSGDSEEEAPSILTPIKAPPVQPSKPKAAPKPLKSALDVDLTESEEEEEEEEEDDSTAMASMIKQTGKISTDWSQLGAESKKKKKQQPPTDIFEPPPVTTSGKSKKSGLMLQFESLSPKTTTKKESKESPATTKKQSSEESPGQAKKEKKKKSKRSKRSKEEEEGDLLGGGGSTVKGGSGNGKVSVPAANDPFGPIASLDAWLNSDSADVVGWF